MLGVIFVGSAAAQDAGTTSLDTSNLIPYRVQPGDTLSKIAFEYCTIWQDIYRLPDAASGTAQGTKGDTVVVRLLDGNGALMSQQQVTLQQDGSWYASFPNVVGQPKSNGSIEAFLLNTGATDTVHILFSGY